ncbi:hypothetical protein [Aquimonas sp.]|jgi:hypothetical protein|uniref:hypothetical protein n=1 Tax=Aquimonas sp. TaxID=1872588 RepID=UPI0037C0BA09
MPGPVDLTGRRFGALVAQSRSKWRTGESAWLCRCDCGSETVVPTRRLSSVSDDDKRAVRSCETCRSRECSICGALYLIAGSTATCGAEACRLEHRRAVNAAAAAAAALRDPTANAERGRRWRELVRRTDPARAAAWREAARLSAKASRGRRDENARAEIREAARERYAENRDQVRAYRERWLEAMTTKKRAAWNELLRAATRRHRQRRALADLMTSATSLVARMEANDE